MAPDLRSAIAAAAEGGEADVISVAGFLLQEPNSEASRQLQETAASSQRFVLR
jgi:hypothetical protein